MPEISRFFGIGIRMFYNDHQPAHLNAEYGDFEALLEIDSLDVYRGPLSRRALVLVLEWVALHHQGLRENWHLAQGGRPPRPFAPLE